ncbi:Nucleoside-diphosphate sugar epimerase [Oopsacas minuta]|uniref:NmrA-like family domain-containing protein 1 n=1 Tax=Oopsacas minuta TaxID=111878 RepID=A0AAV7JTU9_9METZ|nr:Nucleoside-diphosphate sugar epimerase [Oopsacas minuta]
MASESSAGLPLIAVCGATGAQGGNVVRALIASKKFRVRALTRKVDGDKAKSLREMGCEVMKIDFDQSIEEMKPSFDGCHGAFLVTNFWEHMNAEKEYAQGEALAKATKEAVGMKHVIWSTLEDTRHYKDDIPLLGKYKVPHMDEKARVNEFMKKINLPVTFLLTSFYWDNLISLLKPVKQEDGSYSMVYPLGNVPLPGVATVDIGTAVAALFEKGLGEPGEIFGVASEHLLLSEMANILSEVSGKQVKYVCVEPEAYRKMGFPGADELGNMFQFFRDHNEELRAARNMDKVRALIKPTSFKDWCKDNIGLLFKD